MIERSEYIRKLNDKICDKFHGQKNVTLEYPCNQPLKVSVCHAKQPCHVKVQQCGPVQNKKVKRMKILYANTQGIKSKLASLKGILSEVSPDIALFCETHLTNGAGIRLEGYAFFTKPRMDSAGGGVGICVKQEKKSIISPHYSERPLEILWVSVARQNQKILHIGVYYGLQESASKERIKEEMDMLCNEVKEMKSDGDVILCMDANAKIGLLNEPMSRNGRLIMELFEQCDLFVMNSTNKCEGAVTRQHRKRDGEKSAIDFVTASYEASLMIEKVIIDESGDFRMRGKSESDHNTILINISLNDIVSSIPKKVTTWNLHAPAEHWMLFREELSKMTDKAKHIMSNRELHITERYNKWEQLIYKAGMKSIGKTTFKPKNTPQASNEMLALRKERNDLKKKFESEKKGEMKGKLLREYVDKQNEIKEKAKEEEKERLKMRFHKMINEENHNGFWKERRAMKQEVSNEWMVVKDSDGKRSLDPEKNKDIIADYYENLYANGECQHHPHHDFVKSEIERITNDMGNDEMREIDAIPTKEEIKQAIANKKRRKATTDWRNEILKRGGSPMIEMIYPVVEAFWNEEKTPKHWNQGIISNVWKGKGDRECMSNQRGITVSSSIGNIAEEILTNRLMKTITFTQAQAGGRPGASPIDHIFILKSLISIALKKGMELMITFYDIKKAYDRASMDDMLYTLYQNGFDGKVWRLTKAMNVNLTARAKTKAGLTREIKREKGGKQGGKLMVPMFAKMMDMLTSELADINNLGIDVEGVKINCMEYVDDVITLAIGYEQQQQTLNATNEFAVKRQLEWSEEKCKVMEIGKHKEKTNEWKLGQKLIGNCKSYKYLGEIISRDGKSVDNLNEREKKVKCTVQAIMTCGKSDIMKRIETNVLIKLHDSVTIPTLLYGSETWLLTTEERKRVDRMELWAWKRMLNLPITTPTPAVVFSTGALYASIRIDIKQLIYLKTLLSKPKDHWAHDLLVKLDNNNIGWAKQINKVLGVWGLETNWETIAKKTKNQWKNEVNEAAEKMNKKRIKEDCMTNENGITRQKTKTKSIIDELDSEKYTRKPLHIFNQGSHIAARALIMGRFGMLLCGANHSSGTSGKLCTTCKTVDSESHRINDCILYRSTNLYDRSEKCDFDDIHNEDPEIALKIVKLILKVWDLGNGQNIMKVP